MLSYTLRRFTSYIAFDYDFRLQGWVQFDPKCTGDRNLVSCGLWSIWQDSLLMPTFPITVHITVYGAESDIDLNQLKWEVGDSCFKTAHSDAAPATVIASCIICCREPDTGHSRNHD